MYAFVNFDSLEKVCANSEPDEFRLYRQHFIYLCLKLICNKWWQISSTLDLVIARLSCHIKLGIHREKNSKSSKTKRASIKNMQIYTRPTNQTPTTKNCLNLNHFHSFHKIIIVHCNKRKFWSISIFIRIKRKLLFNFLDKSENKISMNVTFIDCTRLFCTFMYKTYLVLVCSISIFPSVPSQCGNRLNLFTRKQTECWMHLKDLFQF